MTVWKRFLGQWLASAAVAIPLAEAPGAPVWVCAAVTTGLLLHARWESAAAARPRGPARTGGGCACRDDAERSAA